MMAPMESQSTATKRLVRRSHDRYIAGVAGGVADYLDVDPVVVRIGFVVLTFFGGAGAVAYAAGWLLMPEQGHTTSIGEDAIHNRNWGRIAGFVLIAIAASIVLRPLWWFGGNIVTAVLLILLGAFLLRHRDRTDAGGTDGPDRTDAPRPPPPPSPPTWPSPTTPADRAMATDQVDRAIATEQAEQVQQTEQVQQAEPVGPTAPMAWPPPPPPPPPPSPPREGRRRRGGLATITIGLLLVGAGVLGLVVAAGNSIEPTRIFAGGLLVVGGALVVSAWFGRGAALIPLGVLLVVLLSAASLIDVPFKGGFGQRTETPTSTSDVRSEYHLAAGELTLDLRAVPFTRGSTTAIEATVGAGHLVVLVPRGVEVDVRGHAGAGQVRFLGDNEGDGGVRVDRDAHLQSAEGAARIELDARVGLGQVEVRDAPA